MKINSTGRVELLNKLFNITSHKQTKSDNMKITVNTTTEREIEIPKFFRIGRHSYKLSSNQKYVTEVSLYKFHSEAIDLEMFPTLRVEMIRYVSAIGTGVIIPITEQEFNNDICQVLTEIEKLMEL
jgi:hypothetical protein